MNEPQAAESASQKERMFSAIAKAGRVRDWGELKDLLDFFIDPHNGTHLLYSLQKEGRITLHEKQIPGVGSKVVDIRPTRTTMTMTIDPQPPYRVIPAPELKAILDREGFTPQTDREPGRPARVVHASSKHHPVGRDGTHPEHHGPVAEGGPVERRFVEPAPKQNEKPLLSPLPERPAPVKAEPEPIKTIHDVIEWSKYPLIAKLTERGEKVAQAAKLLEDAGLMDAALNALESVKYTEFEKEVLALVKDLK